MSQKSLDKLKQMRAFARKATDTLDHYHELFMADGIMDAQETAQINILKAKIARVEKRIDAIEKKLGYFAKGKNTVAAMAEATKDKLSSSDDVVDHSLVKPKLRAEANATPAAETADTTTAATTTPAAETADTTTAATTTPATETADTTTAATTTPATEQAFVAEKTAMSGLIQGGESGAAGYNAYNRGTKGGRILGPVGPKELVKMTIGEIKAHQARGIDDTERLFAVGKYQMIPVTLKEGTRKLGIPDSAKYSPEIQETLFAMYLLKDKRPDIPRYVQGEGDAYKAQLAGAKEWASIGCPPGHPKAGKSYYGSGNHASISAADFLAALDEAKVNYTKYLGQGATPDDAYLRAMAGVNKDASAAVDNNTAATEDTASADGTTGGTDDATAPASTASISDSVGKGGANKIEDVKIVQTLLNEKGNNIKVDGDCGPKTINAIRKFQRETFSWKPDGKVDANGKTWEALSGGSSASGSTGGAEGAADATAGASGPMGKPSWISVAEGETGVKETVGKNHNPRVVEYHQATSGKFNDDETPWCSSFVNWVMQKAGQPKTNNAMASSWRSYGKKLDRPAYGCIGVIVNANGSGHVGFVVGKQGGSLLLLGGNQGNMVKVSKYGVGKFAAFVVPANYQVPAAAYAFGEATGEFETITHAGTR
mgnify:CR=1 FL=1